MNEERGTTVLGDGHIALFLLNIWYMVLPCPASVSAVPRDWEPFMSTLENPLERNHKGPVGKI